MDLEEIQNGLDQKLKKSIHKFVQQNDFNAIATPLKTDEQIKNELEEKIYTNFKSTNFSKNIESAIVYIDEYLKEFEKEDVRLDVQKELIHSIEHFNKVSEEFKKSGLDLKTWVQNKNEPMWKILYGVSTETIMLMYKSVLYKVNQKQYDQAKKILFFILFYAPEIASYWNALGMCFQKEGNLEEAINFYTVSKEINPEHFETYFYLARCYKEKGDLNLAFEQIDLLKQQIDGDFSLKEEWQHSVDELEMFLKGSVL